MDQEKERLQLIVDGRLSGFLPQPLPPPSNPAGSEANLYSMIRFLPKFNERDLDVFFELFEHIAENRRWGNVERTLLLQAVITGRAQDAFIALKADERGNYEVVKGAILKAFELVPEAYRQRFRYWKKGEREAHTELARELNSLFTRWCAAEGVKTFEGLCDLVVLEQFKNIIPDRLTTYINEHKVKTAAEAAVLADEFVLTHKLTKPREYAPYNFSREEFRPRRFNETPRPEYGVRNKTDEGNCHYCLEKGHWKNECPALRDKKQTGKQQSDWVKGAGCVASAWPKIPTLGLDTCSAEGLGCGSAHPFVEEQKPGHAGSNQNTTESYDPFITKGYVSLVGSPVRVPVRVLRDTGASESFIVKSVLPFNADSDTGSCVLIRGIGMQTISVPLHRIELTSDFLQGEVVMAVRPSLPVPTVDVIIGNDIGGPIVWAGVPPPIVNTVPGLSEEPDCANEFPDVFTACAVTRARGRTQEAEETEIQSCQILPVLPSSLPRTELIEAQGNDEELTELLGAALADGLISAKRGYFTVDGLLVRKWLPSDNDVVEPVLQVVIPRKYRNLVLRSAHGGVSGHFGVRKTYCRLLEHFYWPKVRRDVAAFVKTCHVCQITGKPNQSIKPAPLCPIPAVGQPFEHLIIDCVGPLPPSKSGCAYLLTVMCQATRYPAVYPLRTIKTKPVVKALSQFISVFGIPRVIQSDRGSNFTSKMFKEVLQQLHIKQRLSSAYHPQSQGALERFHCTLKALLHAYCVELNREWEDGLPWLLLAAREVVQDSTGFSPNDLVFAHKVRGPLSVLKQDLEQSTAPRNVIEHVNGFRRRLFLAWKLAGENLARAQGRMKKHFDRRAVERVFSPGDQVLVLLPVPGSLFCAKFVGPYSVMRQVT